MKLGAYQDKDRVHLRDLAYVGLIDEHGSLGSPRSFRSGYAKSSIRQKASLSLTQFVKTLLSFILAFMLLAPANAAKTPDREVEQALRTKGESLQQQMGQWKKASVSRRYLVCKALLIRSYGKRDPELCKGLAEEIAGVALPLLLPNARAPDYRATMESAAALLGQAFLENPPRGVTLTQLKRNELIGPEPIDHGNRYDIGRQAERLEILLDHWFPIGQTLDELTRLLGSSPREVPPKRPSIDPRFEVSFDSGFGGKIYYFTLRDNKIFDFELAMTD